jgi:hypothetical protein
MTGKLLNLNVLHGAMVLLLVLFGIQSRMHAQMTYATVHGTVTDASGAVVPNASVTALNTSTGIKTTVTSDSQGYYTLPQLQIGGPYTISVAAAGFQDFQSSGLTLHLNDNREVSAQLQIGAASQTVQVQAAAVQVETADTQLKQVVTAQQIVAMPLLGRDASGLQKLQPGTVESSDRFGNYSANGSQTQSNSYLLDGADINDGPLQSEGIAVNPDALAEENIVTSTLNPEFARNSGAIVNQSIKSGTNQFHGSAFWFYRDTFLNNGNYFSQTRPPFHQNLYGATLGGPVIKNKLFFFLGYQGSRRRTGATTLAPVFNSEQLGGNFSGDSNLINNGPNNQGGLSTNPIPFSINGCAAGTPWNQCFPSGTVQLAQAAYNPISLTLLNKFVPAANQVLNGASYYNFNSPNTGAQDQGVLRADYHLGDNDSIWGSSVFESSPTAQTISFGGSDLPGFGQDSAAHFKLFMASWTHTFNSTTLNELRAGYFRFNFAATNPSEVIDPATYGFNIVPSSPQSNLPLIGVSGLNGTGGTSFLGFSAQGPQPRKDTNLTGADNFTKIIGNHSLKFGVSIEQFIVNNPYFADNNGSYSFRGGGSYSSGDPILDFVLGVPDQYTQTSGSVIDARAYEYYAYGQDSWKITKDLTLNYGLSWDVETPNSNHQFNGLGITCWNVGSQTSQVFPGGPPGLTFPGDPGCNKAGGPTTKWNHFGPRIGFAWSPSSGPEKLLGPQGAHDFAIRGGFGLYYNRDAEEGQLQNLGDPPFLKNSFGAADFGGSPAFANPFNDVAGLGSEPNPFPYTRPGVGAQLDWPLYAPIDTSTYPTNYTVPYSYNFNLNVQRSLSSSMVMQIGYVGSIGRKLVRAYEGDPITSAGHAACLADPDCVADRANAHLDFPQYFAQPATVPGSGGLPWYASMGQQFTDGSSSYHSLQASLTKGPSHGLAFTLAYTFSHGLDNGSGLESSGFNGLGVNVFPGFQQLSYGDSDYDARHRFVASYDYEIPVPAGWKNNLIAREALGGWHITGVTALQTGFPVTITNAGTFNSLYCDQFTYYSCPDNVNTSTFNVKSLDVRKTGSWFDNSIFSQEPIGTFGNAKRNFFHGPGFNYTNLELAKNIPLGGDGSRYLQLRLETFNAFNHANFAAPDGNFTDGPQQFGTVTAVSGVSSADVNGDPQPGRAVQLAAKFYF